MLAGAPSTSDGLVESITEQRAIRKTGQAVVECLVRQLRLELDALRDVSRVEDDAAHPALLSEIGHMCLEVPPFPGLVEHAKDDLGRAAADGRGLHGASVLGVQESCETVTVNFALTTIEHPRDRPSDVATSRLVEHQHEIVRRRDEAAEVRGLLPRREREGPAQ